MRLIQTPAATVVELHFGPDGTSLILLAREYVSLLHGKFIPRVWRIDIRLGEVADQWPLPDPCFDATLSADFRSVYLFCMGEEFGARLIRLDLSTAQEKEFLEHGGAWTTQLVVSPDGQKISWGNILRLPIQASVSTTTNDNNHYHLHTLAHCLAYSPDNLLLATGSPSGGVNLWQGEQHSRHYGEPANHLAWSPDGQLAWGMARRLAVVRPTTDEAPRNWRASTDKLTSLCFSPDSRRLLTGNREGRCSYHDPSEVQELSSYDWGIGPIYSVAFSPDGLTCAAGGEAGRIVVWDVDS